MLLCSLLWLSISAFNAFAVPSARTLLPGDSNCDGQVNVMDVITTVNYIQGFNPQPFCFENADVNGDGIINVMDVIATVNIIMGGGSFACGTSTITDIDGNVYNTVLINNQCWMAENLKTTHYQNGTPIEYPGSDNNAWQNNTTGAYAWYNNDIGWKDSYGALYNWHAVNNVNGLCPAGWRVPTHDEYTELANLFGGGDLAGGPLKSIRTDPDPHPRWNQPNAGATDISGFGALPGASRDGSGGWSTSPGMFGYFWTSIEFDDATAYYRVLYFMITVVGTSHYTKQIGFSVRCIKDE